MISDNVVVSTPYRYIELFLMLFFHSLMLKSLTVHVIMFCSDTSRYGMGSETPMHPSRTPLHPYMTPMRDAGGMHFMFDYLLVRFRGNLWKNL